MSRAVEQDNRRLVRARDTMDRTYVQPLDVACLATIACLSRAHFIRSFRADLCGIDCGQRLDIGRICSTK